MNPSIAAFPIKGAEDLHPKPHREWREREAGGGTGRGGGGGAACKIDTRRRYLPVAKCVMDGWEDCVDLLRFLLDARLSIES